MFRLPARLRIRPRRFVAALALAGFLVATIGMPVVEPRIGPNGKDISRPFPCMHRQCGCRSAAGCWKSCCCHTNREKLIWAEEHGVTPPEYVVAAAAREADPPAKSCCATQRPAKQVAKSCCSTADDQDEPATTEPAAVAFRLGLIPAVAAQKCQGLIQVWLMLSSTAPPAMPLQWQPETSVANLTEPPSLSLLSSDFFPPTPPPKA